MPSRLVVRRAMAFVVAAGLLLYLALRGSGYDLVIRQEVGLAIWGAICVAFAFGVFPRSRPVRALLIPLGFAVLLLLWMVLSLHWTESRERTTAEIARFLIYGGVVVLVIAAINRYTFRAAAAGLSVAAIGVVGLAVASRLAPATFPDATSVAQFFKTDRLDYPLDYWNAIGAWGAMTIAVGVGWSAHARTTLARSLALAGVPVAGLAVYLSYSRGGIIGAAVAVVAVLALARNRWTTFLHVLAAAGATAIPILVARSNDQIADATGSAGGGAVALALLIGAAICVGAVLLTRLLDADQARLPRQTANWAVPAFLAVLVVAVVGLGHAPISNAWDQFKNHDQPTSGADPAQRLTSAGGNRDNLWNSAIDAFQAHPLDGTGPGTFEFWHSRHGPDAEYVRDAHSLYLEHLAELGLPGLILIVGCLGGLLFAALIARSRLTDPGDIGASVALTAAFVVFCVSAGTDWMWEETAIGALAIGGIAIASAGGSGRRRRQRRRGPLLRPGARGVIVGVALIAAMTQVPGLVSTTRVRASQEAVRSDDLSGAARLAEDAKNAEPWASSPRVQLGLVQERQGQLRQAKQSLDGAATREPTNWQIPLLQARIELELGNRVAAKRVFDRGRTLAPRMPSYRSFSSIERQKQPAHP